VVSPLRTLFISSSRLASVSPQKNSRAPHPHPCPGLFLPLSLRRFFPCRRLRHPVPFSARILGPESSSFLGSPRPDQEGEARFERGCLCPPPPLLRRNRCLFSCGNPPRLTAPGKVMLPFLDPQRLAMFQERLKSFRPTSPPGRCVRRFFCDPV